jgi:hypothetical protein
MIETLISIFFVSWFITRFEPLHMMLEILPNKLILNVIRLLLSCLKCVAFWITVLYTYNVAYASAMAFIAFWYDKYIGRLENKVKL